MFKASGITDADADVDYSTYPRTRGRHPVTADTFIRLCTAAAIEIYEQCAEVGLLNAAYAVTKQHFYSVYADLYVVVPPLGVLAGMDK